MLEICHRSIADRSASGARQGYWGLSRNVSRDCRATTVDQSANGARQVYGVLSRNASRDRRATPYVTVAQRPSTNQQTVRDKVMEYGHTTVAQRPT